MADDSTGFRLTGHQFVVQSTDMAMQHALAFSISKKLASGSFWVAYYWWREGSSASFAGGKTAVIARGVGAAPTFLTVPDAVWPKEILPYECKGRIDYYRRKNSKNVLVQLKANNRILVMNMAEQNMQKSDDHLSWNGTVGLWTDRPGARAGHPEDQTDQTLQRGGPWSQPPMQFFTAT